MTLGCLGPLCYFNGTENRPKRSLHRRKSRGCVSHASGVAVQIITRATQRTLHNAKQPRTHFTLVKSLEIAQLGLSQIWAHALAKRS
ncbi:hypothetical protein J6590_002653 [Homalodisca vitripennis]|nr:hypothetical protein J6590_002653 [Homalodisca vitripennis]